MAEGGNEAGGWVDVDFRVCSHVCVHGYEHNIKHVGFLGGKSGRVGGIPYT